METGERNEYAKLDMAALVEKFGGTITRRALMVHKKMYQNAALSLCNAGRLPFPADRGDMFHNLYRLYHQRAREIQRALMDWDVSNPPWGCNLERYRRKGPWGEMGCSQDCPNFTKCLDIPLVEGRGE